jgi:hypothetical protein
MGVITTREQIRYDHGPSFKEPFNPNPWDTAGRTNTIVEDPVMANTVHINTISLYHGIVHRSGMGLGPVKFFQNVENDDDDVAELVAAVD